MARILVVDDQRSAILVLDSLLTGAGHSVASVLNARDALSSLENEPFDLLITDAIMPGGETGYALIRTVRQHPRLAKLPAILVTGKREKEDIERGLQAGTDDYVVKPVDPDILLAKVGRLLARSLPSRSSFAQAPLNAKADWETRTVIKTLSELGLTVESNVAPPLGAKLRVQSSIFREIGIEPPLLRVTACEPMPDQGLFRVQGDFVGLSERELQPLRLWIRAAVPKAA